MVLFEVPINNFVKMHKLLASQMILNVILLINVSKDSNMKLSVNYKNWSKLLTLPFIAAEKGAIEKLL